MADPFLHDPFSTLDFKERESCVIDIYGFHGLTTFSTSNTIFFVTL
jgi:hypothetical protein